MNITILTKYKIISKISNMSKKPIHLNNKPKMEKEKNTLDTQKSIIQKEKTIYNVVICKDYT